jgi:hypothetical protein
MKTVEQRIEVMKSKVLDDIQEAARRGDIRELLAKTKKLETAEAMMDEAEQLLRSIEPDVNVDDIIEHPVSPKQEIPHWQGAHKRVWGHQFDKQTVTSRPFVLPSARDKQAGPEDDSQTAKERGQQAKVAFLMDAHKRGFNLRQERGALYRTESQGLVGIAYASERREGRWFLGLPVLNGNYHAIVLLCKTSNGEMKRFVLPKHFYSRYKDGFSESDGQIKFNVRRGYGSSFQMLIPGAGSVSVEEFIDKYDGLN